MSRPKSQIFEPLPTTIFTVMSALAQEEGAINLGQGFPDEDGPEILRAHAARALQEQPNQYPPMRGLPALREAVSAANRRFYGLSVDPASEVLVTSGATEALADCFLGLLNPGDEAIVFEPIYDSYAPMIRLAGATPVPVRLEPPDFGINQEALARAFGPRTKLIVINSPMNPCGKVFDAAELGQIAALCVRHDAYAVCDEVYEHLVFDGARHHPLMGLPGMAKRTARIGSAGKTFALTGWKVGYVTAPAPLLDVIAKAHQFVTFTTAPALQAAVAVGLGLSDGYFRELAGSLQARRDRLARGLTEAGFSVLPCAGTYFVTAGYEQLPFEETPDALCKRLTREAKVAAIPLDAFYTDGRERRYLRFCFCKSEAVLDEAVRRLKTYLRR
jgi:aspartate/methionine/tyrosine aminotransferase